MAKRKRFGAVRDERLWKRRHGQHALGTKLRRTLYLPLSIGVQAPVAASTLTAPSTPHGSHPRASLAAPALLSILHPHSSRSRYPSARHHFFVTQALHSAPPSDSLTCTRRRPSPALSRCKTARDSARSGPMQCFMRQLPESHVKVGRERRHAPWQRGEEELSVGTGRAGSRRGSPR